MTQKFYICTNAYCSEGHPHWKNTGKASGKKCYKCGHPLRETKSEPRK